MLQTHVNNDIYNKYCLIHNIGQLFSIVDGRCMPGALVWHEIYMAHRTRLAKMFSIVQMAKNHRREK